MDIKQWRAVLLFQVVYSAQGHFGGPPRPGVIDPIMEPDSWVPPDGRPPEIWLQYHGMTEQEFQEVMDLSTDIHLCLAAGTGTQMNNSDVTEFIMGSLLNAQQLDELLQDLTDHGECGDEETRARRKIIPFSRYPSSKWPLPIKYKFQGSQTAADKQMIRAAIAHWESETCLRFEEVGTTTRVSAQHLLFTAKKDGCWSYVGRQSRPKPQQINLQSGGCTSTLGTPVHEIGHAIGFWHEQARRDRDKYIEILTKNIQSGPLQSGQFSKASAVETKGVEYDYGSVMHYGSGDFAKSRGLTTIETVDPLYQKTIGQSVGLSFHDSKLANLAYCADVCPKSLPCLNNGYTDPNDCSKCRCPEGLGGTLCDEAEASTGTCRVIDTDLGTTTTLASGIIEAKDTEICISSPNYGGPYSLGDTCNYIIKAPAECGSSQISAHFVGSFGVYCSGRTSTEACDHWVEVKFEQDLSSRGPRFCCSGLPSAVLVSQSNQMVVSFSAEFPLASNTYSSTISSTRRTPGFKLCFSLQTPCSTTTQSTTVPTTTLTTTPTTTPTITSLTTTQTTTTVTQATTTATTTTPTTTQSTTQTTPAPTNLEECGIKTQRLTLSYSRGRLTCRNARALTSDKLTPLCQSSMKCREACTTRFGSDSMVTSAVVYGCVNMRQGVRVTFKVCCQAQDTSSPCEPDPCLNGGLCEETSSDDFLCDCPAGWQGNLCQNNTDDCIQAGVSPCQNGGQCVDLVADFRCECQPGYTGTLCEQEASETCGAVSPQYYLYTSYTCSKFISSVSSADLLGSRCNTVPLQSCHAQVGLHSWPVSAKVTRCHQYSGLLLFNIEFCCQHAAAGSDPCSQAGQPCQNGGTCVNRPLSYECHCATGFAGRVCQTNLTASCGAWSSPIPADCPIPCGGCGYQTRYRQCPGGTEKQVQPCNVIRCPRALRYRVRCCYDFRYGRALAPPGRYCGRVGGFA